MSVSRAAVIQAGAKNCQDVCRCLDSRLCPGCYNFELSKYGKNRQTVDPETDFKLIINDHAAY